MRGAGARVSSRALLLAPFVLGGVAGAWLIATATEPLLLVVGWTGAILSAVTIALISTVAPVGGAGLPRPGDPEESGARWEPRPVSSWLVRAIAVSAPLSVSLTASVALQRLLPTPEGLAGTIAQVVLLLACGLALVYPAERATRRLAPIAMLLRLSLVFPNAAPSRFRVARRSSDPHELQRELEERSRSDESDGGEVAGMLLALLAALSAHDSRTRGHSERVRVFTEMLGAELGIPQPDRERLRWAALLHDVGKLKVSAEVLNQPAPLDKAQWKLVHRHPGMGAKLTAPLAPWLGESHAAIEQHHEWFDGKGYPKGLAGEEISLGARIIAVADSFDTMVAPRPYRAAMAPAAARREVAVHASTQFDPVVVRALLNLSIPRLWWRIGIAGWTAQLPLLRWTRTLPARWAPTPPDLAALGLAATTFLAGAAGVGLVEAREGERSRGDRVVIQAAQAADTPSVRTSAYGGKTEPAQKAVREDGASGRKRDKNHGAGGGGGGAGSSGVEDATGPGGASGGGASQSGEAGGAGSGGAGSGDGGPVPDVQVQPPLDVGDVNVEPGKSGDGGATGHNTQAENGKDLPSGQHVADNTPLGKTG